MEEVDCSTALSCHIHSVYEGFEDVGRPGKHIIMHGNRHEKRHDIAIATTGERHEIVLVCASTSGTGGTALGRKDKALTISRALTACQKARRRNQFSFISAILPRVAPSLAIWAAASSALCQ